MSVTKGFHRALCLHASVPSVCVPVPPSWAGWPVDCADLRKTPTPHVGRGQTPEVSAIPQSFPLRSVSSRSVGMNRPSHQALRLPGRLSPAGSVLRRPRGPPQQGPAPLPDRCRRRRERNHFPLGLWHLPRGPTGKCKQGTAEDDPREATARFPHGQALGTPETKATGSAARFSRLMR